MVGADFFQEFAERLGVIHQACFVFELVHPLDALNFAVPHHLLEKRLGDRVVCRRLGQSSDRVFVTSFLADRHIGTSDFFEKLVPHHSLEAWEVHGSDHKTHDPQNQSTHPSCDEEGEILAQETKGIHNVPALGRTTATGRNGRGRSCCLDAHGFSISRSGWIQGFVQVTNLESAHWTSINTEAAEFIDHARIRRVSRPIHQFHPAASGLVRHRRPS